MARGQSLKRKATQDLRIKSKKTKLNGSSDSRTDLKGFSINLPSKGASSNKMNNLKNDKKPSKMIEKKLISITGNGSCCYLAILMSPQLDPCQFQVLRDQVADYVDKHKDYYKDFIDDGIIPNGYIRDYNRYYRYDFHS